jgi:hypothetical protein
VSTGRLRTWLVSAALLAACSGESADPGPQARGPLRVRTPVDGSLEFAVLGDFGTGDEDQLEVASALRRWVRHRPIDALVTTGDNIYEEGHPEDFPEAWHQPYGWVDRADMPVLAALGNHDLETNGGAPVMRLFDLPGRWYAHRIGPVEFFVLDGNVPHAPRQAEFLADALRRSSAPWRVAVFHQPAYSCSDHGSTPAIQETWVPLLQAGDVDVVFSGHDHNYQRFPPIRGMVFIVTGGGGARLDGVDDCPPGTPGPVAELDDRHHFLYVRARRDSFRIEAIAVPGSDFVDGVTFRA